MNNLRETPVNRRNVTQLSSDPATEPWELDSIDLREVPGHLLRRAQQRAVELYWAAVGEDGLRPPQFAVLLTIYQNPGLNQTELVQRTGIDRSTVADMISRLSKREMIRRARTETDQRANRLWITDDGVCALNRTAAAAQAAQDDIMAPIPAEHRRQFLDLLKRLADLPQPD